MSDDSVVRMANDIGNFFRAEGDREAAIAGIANHISKFWTRRMREKIIEHVLHAEPGLDDLPQEAVRRVAAQMALAPRPAAVG